MIDDFSQKIMIFVVDDEPAIRESLEGILGDEGYDVCSFPDAKSFFKEMETTEPSLVLLDIWLPDRDGLETLQAIREMDDNAAVIMMSGCTFQ